MAIESPITPDIRRFTADDVWRMVEAGIIHEDEPVEFIDGQLIVVSPQGWSHPRSIGHLTRILSLAYGEAFTVRVQVPLGGLRDHIPEPDVAVGLTDGPWDAERRHPHGHELLLVAEVVVTTHVIAQRKVAIYAEAGAPVYWLVDVPRRQVTVHEGPRPDGTWARTTVVPDTRELALPTLSMTLPVARILPPR
jgi:Uma2 family endonuclease